MSTEKKYDLYVFDMDGTLVDTKLDIARALQRALSDFGFETPSLVDVEKAIGGGAKNAVSKLTGLEGNELTPVLDAFIIAYEQMCSDNSVVYEGGESLLNRLKAEGARLALVTMKLKAPTLKILDALSLDMFDAVVTFDDTDKRKPDPESLYVLLSEFGVSPEQTLVIGDTVTDISYAQAAGADACAVDYGYGNTEEMRVLMPRYMISSLNEL